MMIPNKGQNFCRVGTQLASNVSRLHLTWCQKLCFRSVILQCLFYQFNQEKVEPGTHVHCPLCRKSTKVRAKGVSSLPNNPYPLHMIKIMLKNAQKLPPAAPAPIAELPQCPICGDKFPANEIEVCHKITPTLSFLLFFCLTLIHRLMLISAAKLPTSIWQSNLKSMCLWY